MPSPKDPSPIYIVDLVLQSREQCQNPPVKLHVNYACTSRHHLFRLSRQGENWLKKLAFDVSASSDTLQTVCLTEFNSDRWRCNAPADRRLDSERKSHARLSQFHRESSNSVIRRRSYVLGRQEDRSRDLRATPTMKLKHRVSDALFRALTELELRFVRLSIRLIRLIDFTYDIS